MGIFSDAQGQITPHSKVRSDRIKNEGARVVITLFNDFSDAQGQLTPKSEIESCRNSNSSKLL